MITVFKLWNDNGNKMNTPLATMDVDIIPEKDSNVVIPISQKLRKTYKVVKTTYDYQPITFNGTMLYQCVVYVEVV